MELSKLSQEDREVLSLHLVELEEHRGYQLVVLYLQRLLQTAERRLLSQDFPEVYRSQGEAQALAKALNATEEVQRLLKHSNGEL
jgi:hypothetical protein